VGTYDGTVMRIYVDGVLKAERGASGAIHGSDLALGIGATARPQGDPQGEAGSYFNGWIDEVKIWNRALLEYEVWETRYFGDSMHRNELDDDGDGLSNFEEYQQHTDPINPDSDGDSIEDRTEISLGSSPIDADINPGSPLPMAKYYMFGANGRMLDYKGHEDLLWQDLSDFGYKWYRDPCWKDRLNWAWVEQAKGQYSIDAEEDRLITRASQRGINILAFLGFGNLIYTYHGDDPTPPNTSIPDQYNKYDVLFHGGEYSPFWAPVTEEARDGFSNYCYHVVDHLKDRVTYYEIWNEENAASENSDGCEWWQPYPPTSSPYAAPYSACLIKAAQAVKAAHPKAKIVLGGTAKFDFTFIEGCLQQGVADYVDVIAYHPYRHSVRPEAVEAYRENGHLVDYSDPNLTYEDEVRRLRDVIASYTDKKIELWANEINWWTWDDIQQYTTHSTTQARYPC